MQRKSAFSRRLPDLVTEELVAVLSKKGASFEFKQLFDVVHDRLKKRNAASGGEEMLRLRAYEKLQHLVSRNMVKKSGKKYKGLASLANAIAPEEPLPAPQVPGVVSIKPATVSAIKKPADKTSTKKVAVKQFAKADKAVKAPKTSAKAAAKKAAPAPKPVAKKTPLKKVVVKKAIVKVVKTNKAAKKVTKR